MNITRHCRKFSDKLKALCEKYISAKRVDLFLFFALIAVVVILAAGRFFIKTGKLKRTEIIISSRSADLFGKDTIETIFLEFEEKNPHLKIHVQDSDGSYPYGDVIFFNNGELRSFLKASVLASLAPYTNSEDNLEITHWALPLVSFMDLFFYNIDILLQAGSVRPPKNRIELVNAAKAVKGKGNASPLALGLNAEDPLSLRRDIYPWIWAESPEIFTVINNEGAQNAIAVPVLSKAANNAITFFGQLGREGLLAPEIFEKTGVQRLEEFAEGKIAMMIASARDIPYLQQSGLNFDVSTIPAHAPGKNRLGLSEICAGISASCAVPDEAWALIAFIAGKSHFLAASLGAVPGSYPAVMNGEYIAQDPHLSKAWDILKAAEIIEYPLLDPMEENAAVLIREKLTEILGN